MKVCILTANLGNFDRPVDPVPQQTEHEVTFHCFTDENFPPIADLPPRFQYRIPKMFGWQMFPGYDVYIWLDGSMSFTRKDSVDYFIDKLGDNDMLVFNHPWRPTALAETNHIDEYLDKGNEYITSRYKNGLHKEALKFIETDETYNDDELLASMVFVYKNNTKAQTALTDWWMLSSRYYTVDQIVMAYCLRRNADITVLKENVFKSSYVSLVSEHH